jgi:hypothetical protein
VLRVIQNAVSSKHSTKLDGLKILITGIEGKGFTLQKEVDVVFIPTKGEVGNGIETIFKAPLIITDRARRSTADDKKEKEFQVNLSHM